VSKPITREDLLGPITSEWKPGDTVDYSGVYRVSHGSGHAMFPGSRYTLQHQVICLAGQKFPLCHQCGNDPRFTRIADGEPIGSNEHFKQ
jgi:hypothetical protein